MCVMRGVRPGVAAAVVLLVACSNEDRERPSGGVAALTCALVKTYGETPPQPQPLQGKLVVLVKVVGPDLRETLQPDRVVRVEKDGLELTQTTDVDGCTEFSDPALEPPLAVHVFGPEGSRTIVGDPRQVQIVKLHVDSPSDPDPPLAATRFEVSGLDRFPMPTEDELRIVQVAFPRSTFLGNVLFLAEQSQEMEVLANVPMTLLVAGGLGVVDMFGNLFFEPALLGLVEVPPIEEHGVQVVGLEPSVPIDIPLSIELEAPRIRLNPIGLHLWIEIPNEGAVLSLVRTSTNTRSWLAPNMDGELAAARLLAVASMFSSVGSQEPSFRDGRYINLYARPDLTTRTVHFPAWPAIEGDVEQVGRTVHIPVTGVNLCTFSSRGWLAFRYNPPWEFTFPTPPPGVEEAWDETIDARIFCHLIEDGQPWDESAPRAARVQIVTP